MGASGEGACPSVCASGACVPIEDDPCEDGDACTREACVVGECVAQGATSCDDDDPCTLDGCDSGQGCIYTEVGCEPLSDCEPQICLAGTGCVPDEPSSTEFAVPTAAAPLCREVWSTSGASRTIPPPAISASAGTHIAPTQDSRPEQLSPAALPLVPGDPSRPPSADPLELEG